MAKKDEAKFTIKFNPANPRHREAIRILSEAGRGKATMIADALYVYAHYGAGLGTGILMESKRKEPLMAQQESVEVRDKTISTVVPTDSSANIPDDNDALLQDLANNVDWFLPST